MYCVICNCGCGEEPERGPNGQYLPFTKGHDKPQVAAAFREFKKEAFEKNSAYRKSQNIIAEKTRLVEQARLAEQNRLKNIEADKAYRLRAKLRKG